MCADGSHALIRTYADRTWYLSCVQCPHRIVEGRAEYPPQHKVVTHAIPNDIPSPEETDVAA